MASSPGIPRMAWARSLAILVFGITLGMALAAVLQLSTLQPLEEPGALRFPRRRRAMEELPAVTALADSAVEPLGGRAVPAGMRSPWADDPEAQALRLGLECDKMVALGRPQLETSTVVDTNTGKGIRSSVRTSSGMFLSESDRKYAFVQAIEKRIAAISMIPFENGELMQILRYEKEQEYRPHHDYFADEFNLKRGGQRVATMLMYIREPEDGGETIFPNVGKHSCECGGVRRPGLCVPSTKGNAVLFWSVKLDGSMDADSLHGSCPVLKGEKWSATKWMRQGVFV